MKSNFYLGILGKTESFYLGNLGKTELFCLGNLGKKNIQAISNLTVPYFTQLTYIAAQGGCTCFILGGRTLHRAIFCIFGRRIFASFVSYTANFFWGRGQSPHSPACIPLSVTLLSILTLTHFRYLCQIELKL